MVLVKPWYDPPMYPEYPQVFPLDITTPTIIRVQEIEKKWKEHHIKDVKKGILLTFTDGEEPIFIATDDECFQKILDAINDEKPKIGTKKT